MVSASSCWKHPSSASAAAIWRIISVAGAGTVLSSSTTKTKEEGNLESSTSSSSPLRQYYESSQFLPHHIRYATQQQAMMRFSENNNKTSMEQRFDSGSKSSSPLGEPTTKNNMSDAHVIASSPATEVTSMKKEYDFVVVGHGIAGKSALQSLQELCPQATIAVIDPMMTTNNTNTNNTKNAVDFYPSSRCIGFHPLTRNVQLLHHNNTNNDDDTPTTTTIGYRHSILLATGSRGAPPPHYLLDERALGRILELRPTLLLTGSGQQQQQQQLQQQQQQQQRPIWDANQIRQTVLKAARRGERVAVVGSGWEAIELAVAASKTREMMNQRKKSSSNGGNSCLVFGSKGPLCHVVPQYLSAAIMKRLTSDKHKIDIYHRSLIRYIGSDFVSQEEDVCTGLQLYTAKSYDLLDAARTSVNWLVVAPEIAGSMGTATLPTTNTPNYLQSAQEGRAWYQTWSNMTSTIETTESSSNNNMQQEHYSNLLACYADDGRIAVNAELSAGRGTYAAGSVAKFPNPWTGNADVAGYGLEDGSQAGEVAANNMARDYYQFRHIGNSNNNTFFGRRGDNISSGTMTTHLKHPIPVWRSDMATAHYASATATTTRRTNNGDNNNNNNALKEAGIYALCVGSCDSERFSTQAFWWTNQSKRLKQWLGDDESSSSSSSSSRKVIGRRKTQNRLTANNPTSSLRPVYGRGIVYYIDQDAGKIQGVMIWGLPYTTTGTQLNETLVQHMRKIIQTNGGFRNLGQDSELERVHFVQYLTDASRQLVVDSITPFIASKQQQGGKTAIVQPEDLPRPLIRYTEVRPAGVRRVRVLNRKQEAQGHGFLGEDLYARSASLEEVPPGPLPSFDNLREMNENDWEFEASLTASRSDTTKEERTAKRRARAKALQDWAIWDWYQRRWDENEERARPPKEEMLWLRKGDENRGTSSKERFNESMMKAIFPGGQ